MSINLKEFVVGPSHTNCYVLWDGNEVAVVDPGDCGNLIYDFINTISKDPEVSILLTHGHVDHIGALQYLMKKCPQANFYAGRGENVFLYDAKANLSIHTGMNIDLTECMPQLVNVTSGDEITVGDLHFRVMETPGHTPGSVIYILDDQEMVFCGDTIMKGTVGPTCFPFGDQNKLMTSIQERILVLPKNFQLLPGHGEKTTVAEEIETNPYVLTMANDKDENI